MARPALSRIAPRSTNRWRSRRGSRTAASGATGESMAHVAFELTDEGGAITPWFMFVISLVYCIGADGEFDEEELGYLLTALGSDRISEDTVGIAERNREALDQAISYASETPIV